MRRVTRKFVIFVFGVIFIMIYCEFLIYYLVIAQVCITVGILYIYRRAIILCLLKDLI